MVREDQPSTSDAAEKEPKQMKLSLDARFIEGNIEENTVGVCARNGEGSRF